MSGQSTLIAIPRELRDTITSYVAYTERSDHASWAERMDDGQKEYIVELRKAQPPMLSLVSRQLRDEYLTMYFRDKHFRMFTEVDIAWRPTCTCASPHHETRVATPGAIGWLDSLSKEREIVFRKFSFRLVDWNCCPIGSSVYVNYRPRARAYEVHFRLDDGFEFGDDQGYDGQLTGALSHFMDVFRDMCAASMVEVLRWPTVAELNQVLYDGGDGNHFDNDEVGPLESWVEMVPLRKAD